VALTFDVDLQTNWPCQWF